MMEIIFSFSTKVDNDFIEDALKITTKIGLESIISENRTDNLSTTSVFHHRLIS